VKAACLASPVTTRQAFRMRAPRLPAPPPNLLLSGAIGPVREVHFWTGTHSPATGAATGGPDAAAQG